MRVRFGKLTAILLATTALGLGAIEISANLEAQKQVRRYVARHEGLSVGSVIANPFTGDVVLRNVESGGGAMRLSIGSLTLPFDRPGFGFVGSAFASPFDDEPATPDKKEKEDEEEAEPGPAQRAMPRPEAAEPATPKTAPSAAPAPSEKPASSEKAAAATGAASAENVTIKSGQTIFRIKRIDLTGTSLTNADVASLVDQANPEPIEARLKKLNATSIVMPEVVAEDTTPGSENRATFRQIALSGVVAGRITAGSIEGIALSAKTGEETVNGTTGAVQAVGVDLPQIARVAGTLRTDDAEPIKPIYDSVIVNGINIINGKNGKTGTFALGMLKETNLKARALKIDLRKAQRDGSGKLSDADQAVLYEEFRHSFEVGTLEMTDLAGQGTNDKGPFAIKVAAFTMRDFAKAKIGGMSMRGFAVEGPGVKVGLGGIEVGSFGLPPPKGAAKDAASTMLPASVDIDLTKLDVDVTPKDGDKAADRVAVKVGHVGLSGEGEAGDIPRTSKLTIDNVAFDLPPGNDKAQPLIDMGYSHLDLSAALATTYDPASQELRIRDLTLQGVNMGSVGLGLHLVNVTKGIISQNKEIAKSSIAAVLVKGLSLDVVNQGLADKLLAWYAKQNGTTVEAVKASTKDFLTNQLPASINSANVKIVGEAVAKFIDAPKNLHIDVVSKSGLGVGSMSMLNDPALLIDTLDIKASANK